MPYPGLSPEMLPPGGDPGGGGLSMVGAPPPGAELSAGPDPRDVEFGGPQQFGLSDLSGLHRDATREYAKQGRRDTREARRERRRTAQGLADAEMLMEMEASDKSGAGGHPVIREYMARAEMPNPRQAITDQYNNVTAAGREGLDEVRALGDRGMAAAGEMGGNALQRAREMGGEALERGKAMGADVLEQGGEMGREAIMGALEPHLPFAAKMAAKAGMLSLREAATIAVQNARGDDLEVVKSLISSISR